MKKPFSYKELSGRKCNVAGCRRHLKMNLLVKKPDAVRCYGHHMELTRAKDNYKNGRRIFTTQRGIKIGNK